MTTATAEHIHFTSPRRPSSSLHRYLVTSPFHTISHLIQSHHITPEINQASRTLTRRSGRFRLLRLPIIYHKVDQPSAACKLKLLYADHVVLLPNALSRSTQVGRLCPRRATAIQFYAVPSCKVSQCVEHDFAVRPIVISTVVLVTPLLFNHYSNITRRSRCHLTTDTTPVLYLLTSPFLVLPLLTSIS